MYKIEYKEPAALVPVCTEQCRAVVECVTCRRPKGPIGRDVSAVTASSYCHATDCVGYYNAPLAPHLWPDEPIT